MILQDIGGSTYMSIEQHEKIAVAGFFRQDLFTR